MFKDFISRRELSKNGRSNNFQFCNNLKKLINFELSIFSSIEGMFVVALKCYVDNFVRLQVTFLKRWGLLLRNV